MTRFALPLLLAVNASAGPEALRLEAASSFRLPRPWSEPAPAQPREPALRPPLDPRPFSTGGVRGATVARVNLAAQLDRQRRLLARQLGTRPWDMGVAADTGLRSYYLTFTEPGSAATALAPLDVDRLRGAGVEARLDAATAYHLKCVPNIFSPTRGSTLQMRPTQGTRGPQHDVRTGVLLDAVKARASVFRAGGKEYWLHYGTDVEADGSGFADTRSLLFIHENGLNTRAWPLAESRLPVGAAVTVDLEGTRLSLLRAASGELVVGEVQ